MTDVEKTICIRCKAVPAQLMSRMEDMCIDCFIKYVKYKLRRQMDDFKVNYAKDAKEQHVLLPLSFDRAAVTLLDMMCDLIQLQKSRNNGKQGIYLHALYIEDGSLTDADVRLQVLRQKYQNCIFEDILEYSDIPDSEEIVVDENSQTTASGSLQIKELLNTRTSKQDFDSITKRLIADWYANKNGFQTIIWPLSMTSLSELVISLTAKGRGHVIGDYIYPPETRSPRVVYPLGDLLNSELDLYLKFNGITDVVVDKKPPPATTKLQSIDELVTQYFESVEQGFPAVVSTVMRTAMKLEAKNPAANLPRCKMCNDNIQSDSAKWLEGITVHSRQVVPEGLCYGCIVMVRNSNLGKVKVQRYNVCDVLDEYSFE